MLIFLFTLHNFFSLFCVSILFSLFLLYQQESIRGNWSCIQLECKIAEHISMNTMIFFFALCLFAFLYFCFKQFERLMDRCTIRIQTNYFYDQHHLLIITNVSFNTNMTISDCTYLIVNPTANSYVNNKWPKKKPALQW